MAVTLQSLFQGSELGYGEWHPQKGAKTHRGPAPQSAYTDHVDGKTGLGLVPIRKDGTCVFAAIDIDIDTIDHVELAKQVERLGFPLHVCRSKSGGAHLYWFSEIPIQAIQVQTLLRTWAAALGYGKSEIFPKQVKVDPNSNVGNWINLPYFSGDRTTRYFVTPTGSKSLSEFLSSITFFNPAIHKAASFDTKDMPPCLSAICGNGVRLGGRNEVLFNVAIFYRKSKPEQWEHLTAAANERFEPPLNARESQGIIQSVARTRYNYACEKSPLRDFCDRKSCEKLKFGVKHQPWQEQGVFPEPKYSNLRKITSNPPRYVLRVDDIDVAFAAEEIIEHKLFKRKIFTTTNLVLATMKQQQWDMCLQELMVDLVEIEAPDDASVEGLMMNRIDEFLALHTRSKTEEDLIKQHVPVRLNGHVVFRAIDLQHHLKAMKIDRLEMNEVYAILAKRGAEHKKMTILGREFTVWTMPTETLNMQTEEFTAPDFTKEEPEL